MSSLVNPSRVRAPRTAAAAVERARLALVPAGSSRAPRAPFAVLVFVILGAGVVGLLIFNTHMQQASFQATKLSDKAAALTAKRQALDMELQRLRDPQRLAEAGRSLGMVPPGVPAFVNLSTGKILGTPTVASAGDAMRVSPLPARLPGELNPKPIIRRVKAPLAPTVPAAPGTTATKPGQTLPNNGPASTGAGRAADRNNPASAAQGAQR